MASAPLIGTGPTAQAWADDQTESGRGSNYQYHDDGDNSGNNRDNLGNVAKNKGDANGGDGGGWGIGGHAEGGKGKGGDGECRCQCRRRFLGDCNRHVRQFEQFELRQQRRRDGAGGAGGDGGAGGIMVTAQNSGASSPIQQGVTVQANLNVGN